MTLRQFLEPTGEPFLAEAPLTTTNADNSGGPIVWVGDRFGVAWQDRRDSDYEIYFTLLDPVGTKVAPDTRLTFAPDFSVNPTLTWTGSRFVVAWQDHRAGIPDIFAQLVGLNGAPEGSNVNLTNNAVGTGTRAAGPRGRRG